jgi:two-component system chemotaxis response regulator CheY
MKIIIGDDSPGIRLKLRHYLEDLGHVVVGEAGTGSEAVTLCQELNPDLCLLDIVMPGTDGLAALEMIRKQSPRVLVIMVSSAATVTNILAARKLGAVDFLIKPFKREKVIDVLSKLERESKAA